MDVPYAAREGKVVAAIGNEHAAFFSDELLPGNDVLVELGLDSRRQLYLAGKDGALFGNEDVYFDAAPGAPEVKLRLDSGGKTRLDQL